jgi:hypothetical protein
MPGDAVNNIKHHLFTSMFFETGEEIIGFHAQEMKGKKERVF